MLKSTRYARIEILVNFALLVVAGLLLATSAAGNPVIFLVTFLICTYEVFHLDHLVNEFDGELKEYVDPVTGEVRHLMTYGRVK